MEVFHNKKISNTTYPSYWIIEGHTYIDCEFKDVVFSSTAKLKDCTFVNCSFKNCGFNRNFESCVFTNSTIKGSSFFGGKKKLMHIFKNCHLDLDFVNCNLFKVKIAEDNNVKKINFKDSEIDFCFFTNNGAFTLDNSLSLNSHYDFSNVKILNESDIKNNSFYKATIGEMNKTNIDLSSFNYCNFFVEDFSSNQIWTNQFNNCNFHKGVFYENTLIDNKFKQCNITKMNYCNSYLFKNKFSECAFTNNQHSHMDFTENKYDNCILNNNEYYHSEYNEEKYLNCTFGENTMQNIKFDKCEIESDLSLVKFIDCKLPKTLIPKSSKPEDTVNSEMSL